MENENLTVQLQECPWVITDFIERFKMCKTLDNTYSKIFTTGGDEPVNWYFRLHSKPALAILIFEIKNDQGPNYSVTSQQKCLPFITSSGGKAELFGNPQYLFDRNWSVFICARNILFDISYLFLPNDEFTIICAVHIMVNRSSILYQTLENDRTYWLTQTENNESCVVTIIVNGKEFYVCKYLLAQYSPVFNAMFRCDMKEKRENRVIINDIDLEIFEGVLEYLHTDRVTNIDEKAIGLLAAADKYDIEGLKLMCERSIYKTITTDNIDEILMIADLYNARDLFEYCMEYFINPPILRIIKYCSSFFEKLGR